MSSLTPRTMRQASSLDETQCNPGVCGTNVPDSVNFIRAALTFEENTMKCPICKHGETENGYAAVTLERNETTLVLNTSQPLFVTIVVKNLLTKVFPSSFLA